MKAVGDITPGNPARWFIDGSDTVAFSYEPGADPWYIKMHSDGWAALDILLFANNVGHARSILQSMCRVWRECLELYDCYQWEQGRHSHNINDHRWSKLRLLEGCLRNGTAQRVWHTDDGRRREDTMVLHMVPFNRRTPVGVDWSDMDL